MPAARTETSVTSASPIMSADAVDAVRSVLRCALLRASAPAAPPTSRGPAEHAGQWLHEPLGEERDAEEDDQAPRPIQRSRVVVPRSGPNSAHPSAAKPAVSAGSTPGP